jgi:uncharacterized membrane protein
MDAALFNPEKLVDLLYGSLLKRKRGVSYKDPRWLCISQVNIIEHIAVSPLLSGAEALVSVLFLQVLLLFAANL